MDKQHTNYPSKYAIKEIVKLEVKFPGDLIVFMAKIKAVKFDEMKTYYDVYVEFEDGSSTVLKELDIVFVKDLDKPPHKPTAV